MQGDSLSWSNNIEHRLATEWLLFLNGLYRNSPYRFNDLKGTLMQIWKSLYMFEFIQKQYPESFALLILGMLPVKFVIFFIKNRLIFKIFHFFCMFVNKHFINTGAYISKSKWCYNGKPNGIFFYMKTKIPLNFPICISVPLILFLSKKDIPKAFETMLHYFKISESYIK